MIDLSGPVQFDCTNGGSVTVISSGGKLDEVGVSADGFAFWNDLYVNAAVPASIQVGDAYDTHATVQHVTGDPVLTFNLVSQQPNGTADIRVEGLKPEAWYRLQFNGELAKTTAGRAHSPTGADGTIQWNGVNIPDE